MSISDNSSERQGDNQLRQRDGTFQGYAVNIPGAEWDRLQNGVVYRLVPVNTSDHYRWNVKDAAFVRP